MRTRSVLSRWLPRPRAHALFAAFVLGLGLLACALQSRTSVQPHQWWRERGPVVPHDTFPADCSLCHTSERWRTLRADFVFDHAKETGVALVGAHEKAECLRCHNDRGPVQAFAARGCAGCHEDAHRGQLGSDCKTCHDETNWRANEQIAAHNRTRFPLIGAHAAAACWRCHPSAQVGSFARADTSCVACHARDLARATNPSHAAQGWVDSCERCHIPTSWTGAGFNHASWPLTGQHKLASCTQCHSGGVFAGTPTQCVDCHLADYNGAQNPNHAALGISTTCQQCHSTNTWLGAQFDHTGIVNNCVSCHLADYNATSAPNHTAAGFPTSCEGCHTSTSNWNQAQFNHAFPINSGRHAGFACNECHLTPSNYQQFSCTHCHAHNQSEMDDEHDDVGGYVWQSSACYTCHPQGQK